MDGQRKRLSLYGLLHPKPALMLDVHRLESGLRKLWIRILHRRAPHIARKP